MSFDYIDWKNSEFGPLAREYYYEYKKFGILPEKEYAINKVKKVEQFIKEQEEESFFWLQRISNFLMKRWQYILKMRIINNML